MYFVKRSLLTLGNEPSVASSSLTFVSPFRSQGFLGSDYHSKDSPQAAEASPSLRGEGFANASPLLYPTSVSGAEPDDPQPLQDDDPAPAPQPDEPNSADTELAQAPHPNPDQAGAGAPELLAEVPQLAVHVPLPAGAEPGPDHIPIRHTKPRPLHPGLQHRDTASAESLHAHPSRRPVHAAGPTPTLAAANAAARGAANVTEQPQLLVQPAPGLREHTAGGCGVVGYMLCEAA